MLQGFLQDYGYLALFIGTFFEGETILVLAGFLAARGYMDINWVMLTAACGGYCGDHLRRYPDLWVLVFRFVYGLRTVMPVAIGISGYAPLRFLLLNAISAALWAVALGMAAYHLGAALEQILDDIKHYELWVAGALLLGGSLLWIWRWLHNRHAS